MKLPILICSVFLLLGCSKNDSAQVGSANGSDSPLAKKEVSLKSNVDISGQVFVVTNGRENIKLALVEVSAIPEQLMIDYMKPIYVSDLEKYQAIQGEARITVGRTTQVIATAKKQYRTLTQAEYKKATADQKKAEELILAGSRIEDGASYFDKLPTSIVARKTDADGKFSMSLPVGKYVLAASGDRLLSGTQSEHYYWLVSVDTSTSNRTILLSNDNFFKTACSDCFQPKKYSEDVAK